MRKCGVIKMSGTISLGLVLLCLLMLITVPASALALSPLTESANVAIDEETGDIYLWNEEVGQYERIDNDVDTSDNGVSNVYVIEPPAVDSTDTVGQEEVVLSAESVEDIAATVAEYDAAEGYNLGTSYLTIFQGMAYKVPFNQHYVYWRNGQYEYCFAYGDIAYDGTFTSTEPVTVVSYATTGNYNGTYTWTTSSDSAFSLSVSDQLVYSDLGDFPDLINRKEQKLNATSCYMLVAVALWALFSNLRKAAFGR